jgi:NADH/NAD ratio-sensing transcriptional regulator Rex
MNKTKPKDVNKLNRSLMSNEIKIVMKTLPTRNAQDWMDSLLNSTRFLRN